MKKTIIMLVEVTWIIAAIFTQGCVIAYENITENVTSTDVSAKAIECKIINGQAVVTGYNGNDSDVVIPSEYNGYPVTIIGERAFAESGITSMVMPDSITVIENEAFIGCCNLGEIIWSSRLERIGAYCFADCISIRELKLPDSVQTLGGGCFENCIGIYELNFPAQLTVIPESCFYGCVGITELVIPAHITTIEYGAFYNIPNLKTVYAVHGTGAQELFGFPEWTVIEVSHEQGTHGLTYEIIDGFAYVTGFTLPDDNADHDSLVKIIVPYVYDGYCVAGIADNAFSDGVSQLIRTVEISYGVSQIGENAFDGCSNMIRIDLPTSISYIAESAFAKHNDNLTVVSPESEYLQRYFSNTDVSYYCDGEYSFG